MTDFDRYGLQTQFDLDEKASYLRSMGALDDSNASGPMVIVPNYLTLLRNCLQATQLFTVCCRNECEAMLASLEKYLCAPEASPAHIIQLVEQISSEAMPAPRKSRLQRGRACRRSRSDTVARHSHEGLVQSRLCPDQRSHHKKDQLLQGCLQTSIQIRCRE